MSKLILWSRDHPFTVIFVIGFISLFFAFHARNLYLDTSAEGMMIENDPDRAFYSETLKTFGSDNISVVYVRDENLFTAEKLLAVEEVFYQLQEIPGVSRVDALFNTTNFKGEDGILQTNPLLDGVPENTAELATIKADALRNPLLNKTLISPDGKGIALSVVVDYDPSERGFNIRIANAIDKVIAPLKGKVNACFQLGIPMTRRVLGDSLMGDQKTLVPLSAFVLLLMLMVGIRTFNGGFVPMLTGGLSILWVAGYMALTNIPINVLTVVVPSLLIVIGSTEDMHMVAEYMEGLENGRDRLGAIDFFARRLGLTVFLTAFTTYLGFLSIVLNDITLLRQFGYVSSFGFLVNPIITFTVIPVYLRFFGEKKLSSKHHTEGGGNKGDIYKKFADWLVDLVDKRRKALLWVSSFITLAVAVGIFFVNVDNDLLGYFKPSSEIRVRSKQLHEELSGSQNFFLTFNAKGKGAFKKAKNLNKIFEIQQALNQSGRFDSSLSLADHVALIHREMNDGKQEAYSIPDKDELISQYLLFFTREDLERYASADYRKTNIIVRHNLSSSYELKEALHDLEAVIRQKTGDTMTFKFTGEGILINKAADTMASGQIASLTLLLLVVFGIMAVLFVQVKAGLLSMAANIMPIIALFGIMGYFKIPLGVGTAMIADIAIGIAIDDTIHLMVRYNSHMKRLNDQVAALRETMREEMQPVFVATAGLSLGFSVLAFSNFVPLIYFGLLSGLVMVLGFVAELFVTTSLLASTKLITLWDLLGLSLTERVIKISPLFKNMSKWQIKKVVLLGHTREIPKEDFIIRQGAKDRSMYLILEGKAKAEYTGPQGARVHLQEFLPGDVFGEIALMNEVERTADVIATEQTRVLSLDWPALERVRKTFPRISAKFFLNISRILGTRLAVTDAQLGKLQAASLPV